MNTFVKNILVSCGLFLAFPALAAHVRGNGGDVIVCSNSNSSPIMLDYYEAEHLYGLKLNFGAPSLSVFEKVALVLNRIPYFDQERRARLLNWAGKFESEANFQSSITLTDVQDSFQVALPEGCVLAQIAVQEVPRFSEARRYIISKDLWDRMDRDQQAGLVLHEIIYRESLSYGHSDSVPTRYFNAVLASGKIGQYTPSNYNDLMQRIGYPNDCIVQSKRPDAQKICFEYGTYDSKSKTGRLAVVQKLKIGCIGNWCRNQVFASFVGEVELRWAKDTATGESLMLLKQGQLADNLEWGGKTFPAGTIIDVSVDGFGSQLIKEISDAR